MVNFEVNDADDAEVVMVSENAVAEFLTFLDKKEEYLDTGLGAFHTDNHSNW